MKQNNLWSSKFLSRLHLQLIKINHNNLKQYKQLQLCNGKDITIHYYQNLQ